jgi:hypothetical protein
MAKHTFIISDESVNVYGFRLMSSGAIIDSFLKNPIMLYAHIRPYDRPLGDPLLPIGKWENLRQEGSRWLADAVFDEDDEFAMKISKKVEKGILNACSVGVDVVEYSEDPALMLPGQTLPTMVKWILDEISIADLPGNKNAVKLKHNKRTVTLSDKDSNPAELSKLFPNNKTVNEPSMKSIIAKLNVLKIGITLSDSASESEILLALDRALSTKEETIAEKDRKIVQLTGEVTTYKEAKEAAEQKAKDDSATALVDAALSGNKITAVQKDHYMKLAKLDYEATKSILDGIQPYKSVMSQLTGDVTTLSKADKIKKYDELHRSNQLANLKTTDPAAYSELFEAKYDKKPKQ